MITNATQTVSTRMRQLRRARGWSAERLAEEMSNAGVPWNRGVVTKLETGRRDSVTVAELVGLAAVFGVSPLELLPAPQLTGNAALATLLAAAYTTTWQACQAALMFGGDVAMCADTAHDNAARAIAHAERAGYVTVERDLETRRITAVRPAEPK